MKVSVHQFAQVKPLKLIWTEQEQRKSVFLFYKRFMPYARISKKESIALLIADDEHILSPESSITDEHIMASLRLRPVGEFNLLIGMLVHPNFRGEGIAHELLSRVENSFISGKTYLFSLPHLIDFYRKHGFSDDIQAPNDIKMLYKKYTEQGKELIMMGYQIQSIKAD